MRKHKRLKVDSNADHDADENDVNSFDSGIDASDENWHKSCLADSFAGKIETLHIINFMCHSNLEVSFNKRITFVTGKNGSGKSAIMAALVAAFGGSASTTGRGVGITDFIKKGETWAKVSVTFINDGINSYRRDIYGKRITIVRSISKNAASTYTCKSEFGEVVSKKKDEIDRICTALDIQIKNPICILNQDVARSFLSSTDSKMRYSLFMQATHLESLKTIYSETLDLLRISQNNLDSKKLGISAANKEIRQLKEKLEYFASLEKYVNERTTLENEYLWSLVCSEEKSLEVLQEEQKRIEQKKEECVEGQVNFQSVIEELENNIKETKEKLSNLGRNQSDEDKVKKKDLQAEIQNLQRQINTASGHVKQLVTKCDRYQSDINSIQEHLKQSEEAATQSQEEKDKIASQISKLKEDLLEVRDRIKAAQRDNDNGLETKLQYTLTLENLKSDLNDLELSKKNLERQIERTNVGDNTLLKYGPFAVTLRDAIEEAVKRNKFQKKPVGPCGLYVTLTGDSKWARAVESVVGGLMNTYCCDNQMDFQVLSRIMDKVCGAKNPPIIISKFQNTRHNVESEKVSVRGLKCVLDVLHFTNDVVFNTFIDQARIETILLFETDSQAASLLTHIQNVPKNLRMGLTVNSDQYYPAPNYRTYYGDSNRTLKYFDAPVKSKAAKEKLEQEIHTAQLASKEKNLEIADATSKLVKVTDFLRKTESNLKLLKQNERRIEAQINQLKDEEESRPILPTRVALEKELSILQESKEELRTKIDRENESVETLKKEQEERSRQLQKITERENILNQEISSLQEKLDQLKYKLNMEKDKNKNLSEKFKEVELELERITKEMHSAKKSLAHAMKAATEVHKERILTDRSPVEVQKLLEKCEKYLQAAETKLDSKESIINEYKVKHKRYKDMKEKFEILEKVVNSLLHVAAVKKDRFQMLQSHTANLVSFHFQACLQTRGFNGQLKFDFQNQTLELEVVPRDGIARKDAKTLSGGERSYAAVSFILAVWRAVQMPFYFLDEFDVFMDKVNRKVIMDLLLEHAKSQRKMQFIFITPQDISSIQASDIISVYRMPDPRR